MSTAFMDALHRWQNFYFMTGGAAATLIGLLFIAISLGWHLISRETDAMFDAYITPILIHFISVLVLAGMMLVPTYPPFGLTVLFFIFGIAGALEMMYIVRGNIRAASPRGLSLHHWFWNVILPGAGYALVLGAAVWLALNESVTVLYLIAVADALLLIDGIWRSWETVIWIVHQPR